MFPHAFYCLDEESWKSQILWKRLKLETEIAELLDVKAVYT